MARDQGLSGAQQGLRSSSAVHNLECAIRHEDSCDPLVERERCFSGKPQDIRLVTQFP